MGLELEIALNKALEAGYRLIDTASGYGNEQSIGKVLNEWISSGKVNRDELFVTTRVRIRFLISKIEYGVEKIDN